MTKIGEAEQLAVYFNYLDELRESGATNMFGAAPYARDEFAIDIKEARRVLGLWQKTFDPDQPSKARAIAAIAGLGSEAYASQGR